MKQIRELFVWTFVFIAIVAILAFAGNQLGLMLGLGAEAQNGVALSMVLVAFLFVVARAIWVDNR